MQAMCRECGKETKDWLYCSDCVPPGYFKQVADHVDEGSGTAVLVRVDKGGQREQLGGVLAEVRRAAARALRTCRIWGGRVEIVVPGWSWRIHNPREEGGGIACVYAIGEGYLYRPARGGGP